MALYIFFLFCFVFSLGILISNFTIMDHWPDKPFSLNYVEPEQVDVNPRGDLLDKLTINVRWMLILPTTCTDFCNNRGMDKYYYIIHLFRTLFQSRCRGGAPDPSCSATQTGWKSLWTLRRSMSTAYLSSWVPWMLHQGGELRFMCASK